MSYIDTIKHNRVGFIAGYPIYHPLEYRENKEHRWGDYDFSCAPYNLVIGGGSGEHPALVVHHLGELVALYLLDYLEVHEHELRGIASDSYDRLQAELNRLLDVRYDLWFEYCGWGVENFARFLLNCSSPAALVPYSNKEHGSFERWLALSLGHYCFHYGTIVSGSLVTCLLAMYPELLCRRSPGLYENVMTLPPPRPLY